MKTIVEQMIFNNKLIINIRANCKTTLKPLFINLATCNINMLRY